MPTALLNGIDVYYERAGAGKRLLFLNGSGSSLAHTSVLVDVFRARMDVVAHDQRGLGADGDAARARTTWRSTPPTRWPCSTTWAGRRAGSSGVSFGGMVAQELAVTAPERVERLALVCTSPGGAGRSSYPLHELAAIAPRPSAPRSRPSLLDTRFDRGVAGRAPRGPRPGRHAWPSADRGGEVRRGTPRARRSSSRRGGTTTCGSRLGRVPAPTFVAAGRYDGIAPLANSEAIVKAIPGSDPACVRRRARLLRPGRRRPP